MRETIRKTTRFCAAAGFVLAIAMSGGVANAVDNYPTKPVTIISPYPPGSFGDVYPRAVAGILSERLGQNFLVENQPGATHIIGARAAAAADPDGHTLLFGATATFVFNEVYQPDLPYSTLVDFEPITLSYSTPLFLVTRPDLEVDTVQDLIAVLEENPGSLTFASGGEGSTTHMAAELFKSMTGTDARHVPYGGTGPAMIDVMAGHVDFIFSGSGLQQAEGGRMRVLATTSAERSDQAPDVPTMQESGVEDYEFGLWFGFVAPAGTPTEITELLADTMRDSTDELQNRLGDVVADGVFVNSSPAEMRAVIEAQIPQMREVVESTRTAE